MSTNQAILLAHHKHVHDVSLWAVAHGSQGQGPRILLLAVAAIICAVVISLLTSRKKA